MATYSHDAFISYSHSADGTLAPAVEQAVGGEFLKSGGNRRLV